MQMLPTIFIPQVSLLKRGSKIATGAATMPFHGTKLKSSTLESPVEMPRQGVRFSETSEMVFVPSLSVSHYKRDLWFTADELRELEDDARSHARIVQQNLARGVESVSRFSDVLGFEKYLSEQLAHEYKSKREEHKFKVLDEANGQHSHVKHRSIERLARISAKFSMWAREQARMGALFLEQDLEYNCQD